MHPSRRYAVAPLVLMAGILWTIAIRADNRKIDPTYLYRDAKTAPEKPSDITTATCHYKPLFGKGDSETSVVVGIARYGEAVIDPHGSCARVQYPQEDQVYVVLQGNGSAKYADDEVPLKTEDYLYIPSTVPHALTNTSTAPLTVVVMGFYTKGFEKAPLPSHPLKANIEDVPTTLVNGHPDSSRSRLLMGDIDSKRDRIAAGRVLTSLFLMEIAPGGTNFPHHHQREEEIYLILSGHGVIVAGGGRNCWTTSCESRRRLFFSAQFYGWILQCTRRPVATALRSLLVSGHATKGSTALICREYFDGVIFDCFAPRCFLGRDGREMERISWEEK